MTPICPTRPLSSARTAQPQQTPHTQDRADFEAAADLVRRASNGEDEAWSEILRRYTPMLRGITRTCGLPPSVANDVIQTTWLRLAEGISRIREPEALRTWLATVTRREAWRAASACRRTTNSDDLDPLLPPSQSPESEVLMHERIERLRVAIDGLPARQRAVILHLAADPAPSYSEIAEMTGMPIGSIGPTRARALARLRLQLDRDDDLVARHAATRSTADAIGHNRTSGFVEVAS